MGLPPGSLDWGSASSPIYSLTAFLWPPTSLLGSPSPSKKSSFIGSFLRRPRPAPFCAITGFLENTYLCHNIRESTAPFQCSLFTRLQGGGSYRHRLHTWHISVWVPQTPGDTLKALRRSSWIPSNLVSEKMPQHSDHLLKKEGSQGLQREMGDVLMQIGQVLQSLYYVLTDSQAPSFSYYRILRKMEFHSNIPLQKLQGSRFPASKWLSF